MTRSSKKNVGFVGGAIVVRISPIHTQEFSHTGEKRGERSRYIWGWTAKNDDTAAARSRYEVVWRLLLLLLRLY